MDRIKRLSNELLNEYSERFGTDFSTNKQALNEISIIRSKGLKNEIAGYITKMLQRQAKFEQRKQILIENEKKSQEHRTSRSKKSDPEAIEAPTTEPEAIEAPTTEPEAIEAPTTEPESVEEKTIAEEIIDESKSE